MSARAGDRSRDAKRTIKVPPSKSGLDVQPGQLQRAVGLCLGGGQRPKFSYYPHRCLQVTARGCDLSPAYLQELAAEWRRIQDEALLNHVESLVPAARQGQRLGQARRDRRGHIPGQTKLPGPGKIGPPGPDCGVVLAPGLQRVGDLHPGQQFQRPRPDPPRSLRRFLQVRENVTAFLRAQVGQPDLRLDPERLVIELSGQVVQFPGTRPGLLVTVAEPQDTDELTEDLGTYPGRACGQMQRRPQVLQLAWQQPLL